MKPNKFPSTPFFEIRLNFSLNLDLSSLFFKILKMIISGEKKVLSKVKIGK